MVHWNGLAYMEVWIYSQPVQKIYSGVNMQYHFCKPDHFIIVRIFSDLLKRSSLHGSVNILTASSKKYFLELFYNIFFCKLDQFIIVQFFSSSLKWSSLYKVWIYLPHSSKNIFSGVNLHIYFCKLDQSIIIHNFFWFTEMV